MTTHEELTALLESRSFNETRGDDSVDLISLDDAAQLILENFLLVPRNSEYEYGYAREGRLNKTIVLIGDQTAYDSYILEITNNPNAPVQQYFRRPRDTRNWEEISGPDAIYL